MYSVNEGLMFNNDSCNFKACNVDKMWWHVINNLRYTSSNLVLYWVVIQIFFVTRKYNAFSVHASVTVVEDVTEDAGGREDVLFHFQACECTAERELRFYNLRVIIVIVTIVLLSCASSSVYIVAICKILQKRHIAGRTARELVGW
jgi:hypothetical protein